MSENQSDLLEEGFPKILLFYREAASTALVTRATKTSRYFSPCSVLVSYPSRWFCYLYLDFCDDHFTVQATEKYSNSNVLALYLSRCFILATWHFWGINTHQFTIWVKVIMHLFIFVCFLFHDGLSIREGRDALTSMSAHYRKGWVDIYQLPSSS